MKILSLLPALFIYSPTMSMDNQTPLGSDSSHYLSFSEGTTSTFDDIQQLVSLYTEGTSSGSAGEDDRSLQPKKWHWTQADVFIIPNDPLPHDPEKPIIPKLNLNTTQRPLALKKEEKQSAHATPIDTVIPDLKKLNVDSPRPRSSSSLPIRSSSTSPKKRVLSHETFLTKPKSRENIRTADSTPPNSPITTPPTTTPSSELTPPPSPREITQISHTPVAPPTTPSSQPTSPISRAKTNTDIQVQQQANPQEKDASDSAPSSAENSGGHVKACHSAQASSDATSNAATHNDKAASKINNTPQKTNPTSMQPLTWQKGGVALLTITGLLSLLYYLDRLPANITAKIDDLLATLRMNR